MLHIKALIDRAQSASKDLLDEEEDPLFPPAPHVPETEEDRAVNYGPYSRHYETLHTIGKGAFGFVKLACTKQDTKQVCILVSSYMLRLGTVNKMLYPSQIVQVNEEILNA